jgi:hypothetical protein
MTTSADSTGASVTHRLLDAIVTRDFDAMSAVLAPDVRMRALLPHSIVETDTAATAIETFREWFGAHKACEAVSADQHTVGAREFFSYNLHVRPDWAPDQWHTVEQAGYCRIADDRVIRLDLVCTGYFPAERSDDREPLDV